MAKTNVLPQSIQDWELYFTNRNNTYEISGNGGGSKLDWFVELKWMRDASISGDVRINMYANMVQAVLNRWNELVTIIREPYESDPVTSVAYMAFDRRPEYSWIMDENLRSYYNRLWEESPRPHSNVLRQIAISSDKKLPVSYTEIGLLFEQTGWALVACRLAANKSANNLAADLLQEIIQTKREEVDIWLLRDLVDSGFPKVKALRLSFISLNNGVSDTNSRITSEWENELIAEGLTREQIYSGA